MLITIYKNNFICLWSISFLNVLWNSFSSQSTLLIIFINIYIYIYTHTHTHTNFIHFRKSAQWWPIVYLNIPIKYTLVATFYIASCYNRYHRSNISAYTDLGYLLNLNTKIHPLLSSHFPFVWYRYHPFFFLTTWGRNAMEFLKLEFDDRSSEKYFLRLISIYFQALLSSCKYG